MANSPSLWSKPEWVTEEEIRSRFNQGRFLERLQQGQLATHVFGYDTHLNKRQRQKRQEPKCTRSQMVLYRTLTGEPVALAHQYRRPDGSLGGGGRPDPKRLLLSDRVIAVRQTP
ncbi:MAG TPA: hypothetical protein VJO15_00905 [Dehalococcoidia bacterium]|nr:hypothetical protein [Dehalococcoidia bacterium]